MTTTEIPLRKVMSSRLITLHPKDRLSRAKDVFDSYKIHHIPIQVMGQLRGIISLGDLLFLESVATNSFDEFIQAKKLELCTVDAIMTPNPITIEVTASVQSAVSLMLTHRINALPVLDDDGQLVGIVTSRDMLKLLNDLL
jgi:acetoin utilization protein AcuB